MNRLIRLIRFLYQSSFVRFAMVGGVATAVNYGTYTLLIWRFAELDPTFAYIMAFCVSIVCNFLLSSYFTFRIQPSWPRALKFLTAHLINLFNELVLLNFWLWVGISKFVAPLLVFAIAFPINYFMVRFVLKGRLSDGVTQDRQ